MLRRSLLIYALLVAPFNALAAAQTNKEGVRVEGVASTSKSTKAQAAFVTDALSIGAVTLRLGMQKDAVLSNLGKHYSLQRAANSTDLLDDWTIHDKTRADEVLGDVRFRSGKLTLASKQWTHESKEYSGADTAEILYKVVSKFVADGNVNCTLRTFTSLPQSGPGHLEFRQTEITCGHRQIDVTLSWQSGPGYVQVDESIRDDPEMPWG